MKRLYEHVIRSHFQHHEQMLFLTGPRQVGKTTISLSAEALTANFNYLNWDNQDHRQVIIEGPAAVTHHMGLKKLQASLPIIVFDELHKYRHWKTFLKGFFDTYRDRLRIIVTGSSKLDIYRKGGDSLMGRYFPYRIHPISIAECMRTLVPEKVIHLPQAIEASVFDALYEYGGFPEPFLKRNSRFSQRWQRLRKEQLFQQDIRDLSRIQEIDQLEVLAELIKHQAAQLVNYSNFAKKVRVSVDTIRRWVNTLNSFYYCFIVRPWTKNISRSLLKEPKIYLWDWANIDDPGQRSENFIAAHLLKAVHFWCDQGFGNYDLFFLRDKEKREIDFIVTKDNKPWFLVEVKNSANGRLNHHLELFQNQSRAQHAFQVVLESDYVDVDCFSQHQPIIVPAKTLLSQLI